MSGRAAVELVDSMLAMQAATLGNVDRGAQSLSNEMAGRTVIWRIPVLGLVFEL